MKYFLTVIFLLLGIAAPIYWEGWHENFCTVEFLCYEKKPNWLGYLVFYASFFAIWYFFAIWQGPRKGHVDDDR